MPAANSGPRLPAIVETQMNAAQRALVDSIRSGPRGVFKASGPFAVYLHPWEFDPDQPRLAGRFKSRLRHYTNLNKTASRFGKLIRLGEFGPFRDSQLCDGAQPFLLTQTTNT